VEFENRKGRRRDWRRTFEFRRSSIACNETLRISPFSSALIVEEYASSIQSVPERSFAHLKRFNESRERKPFEPRVGNSFEISHGRMA